MQDLGSQKEPSLLALPFWLFFQDRNYMKVQIPLMLAVWHDTGGGLPLTIELFIWKWYVFLHGLVFITAFCFTRRS